MNISSLKSSLGFHTLSLSLFIPSTDDCYQLLQAFSDYRNETGLIQIYFTNHIGDYSIYRPNNVSNYPLPNNITIIYCNKDKGIKWKIRTNDNFPIYGGYYLEAIINPKILSGISDYITAANLCDLNVAITNFDSEARKISPLLRCFNLYNLTRIDYCINLDISELAPGCTPEQIMNLIRRADIPTYYREWIEYDKIAHRKKSKPSSFYLISRSLNINCYSKYMQLQEKTLENISKGFPPVPENILNSAKSIIRFEIQCKYHRMYTLKKTICDNNFHPYQIIESLLNPEICKQLIQTYYYKIIGEGNWYSLQSAIEKIENKHFNKQKEIRLISVLKRINHYRSIAKAKEVLTDNNLLVFKHTLKDLNSLGINPITIPKEWGIKEIPNLLNEYLLAAISTNQ